MTKHKWVRYDSKLGLALLEWWNAMRVSGDLPLAFHKSTQPLDQFMAYFASSQHPLLVTLKDGQILAAVWFQMFMDVPAVGAWVRDHHNPGLIASVRDIIYSLVAGYNSVILVTSQPAVAVLNEKLGARKVGVLTGVSDGQDVTLFQLTWDAVEAKTGREQKHQQQQQSFGAGTGDPDTAPVSPEWPSP